MRLILTLAAAALVNGACAGGSADPDADARAVVQAVYDGFAAGDIALATSTMDPAIIWNEAESNPYADGNPYLGPDAVVGGVFVRIIGEWDGFTATPSEYVIDGDRVVVFGRYAGTYRATGKAVDIPFVHSYRIDEDRIVSFQQYTDTASHNAAMAAD